MSTLGASLLPLTPRFSPVTVMLEPPVTGTRLGETDTTFGGWTLNTESNRVEMPCHATSTERWEPMIVEGGVQIKLPGVPPAAERSCVPKLEPGETAVQAHCWREHVEVEGQKVRCTETWTEAMSAVMSALDTSPPSQVREASVSYGNRRVPVIVSATSPPRRRGDGITVTLPLALEAVRCCQRSPYFVDRYIPMRSISCTLKAS
mmetsp:Transcript_24098/g.57197  ORF Transcript_24098/g.57197 Transcript_24098/m.57197 type:complete len:205 (+) Transcript_24098:419-1033(+)